LVTAERSLDRNPSVLSRKELIKQEYNLLLENRLPNIMQLMKSEKNLGLGMGFSNKVTGSPFEMIVGSRESKKNKPNQ